MEHCFNGLRVNPVGVMHVFSLRPIVDLVDLADFLERSLMAVWTLLRPRTDLRHGTWVLL